MFSEGSFDTGDWSHDTGESDLPSNENNIYNLYYNRKQIF